MRLELYLERFFLMVFLAVISVSFADPVRAVAPHTGEEVRPGSIGAALQRLERAAGAGDAEAAFQLGVLYASGTHVTADPLRAEALLRQAAGDDHVEAQHRLGLFLLGDGAAEDRIFEGLFWLGAAAERGDAFAAVVLGMLHERGMHGVRQSLCLAVDWYEVGELMGVMAPPHHLEALRAESAANCD